MLLLGLIGFGAVFSLLLQEFTPRRLIQVVQGAAVITLVLNLLASWKQEPRRASSRAERQAPAAAFGATWARFAQSGRTLRFMVAVGLGTAAFNMQDIILEPYGGEVLHLSVGATTLLTALMAAGSLLAFGLGARWLTRGLDAMRLAAAGVLVGVLAFSAVIFAEPLQSALLFRIGVFLIGFGAGLFAVGTLTHAMGLDHQGLNGLAVGAWGAVQATLAGVSIALGGALRDTVTGLATHGALGDVLGSAATGYSFVYHIELYLMFATLIAIGPLVQGGQRATPTKGPFGLAQFPG